MSKYPIPMVLRGGLINHAPWGRPTTAWTSRTSVTAFQESRTLLNKTQCVIVLNSGCSYR